MSDVYIYTLSDSDTKEIRYVGKTINPSQRERAHFNNLKGINLRVNWIKSLKTLQKKPLLEVVDIVSPDDWEFWEKYWISQFKQWGFRLVNTTDGGEKGKSFKHTENAKKKISIAQTGRKMHKAWRNAISQGRKGMKFDDEHRKNLSIARQKNISNPSYIEPWSKKVVQIDAFSGKKMKTFNSISEAEDKTGANNSTITACCKGRRKISKGFYWCYAENFDSFYFEPYKRIGRIPESAKKVIQIDVETGGFIQEFRSIKQASELTGSNRKQIMKCLSGKGKTAGGYKWEFPTIY